MGFGFFHGTVGGDMPSAFTYNRNHMTREDIKKLWEVYAYANERSSDCIDVDLLIKSIYLAELMFYNDKEGLDKHLDENPHLKDDISLLCINILQVYREKNFHKCQGAVDFLSRLSSSI